MESKFDAEETTNLTLHFFHVSYVPLPVSSRFPALFQGRGSSFLIDYFAYKSSPGVLCSSPQDLQGRETGREHKGIPEPSASSHLLGNTVALSEDV